MIEASAAADERVSCAAIFCGIRIPLRAGKFLCMRLCWPGANREDAEDTQRNKKGKNRCYSRVGGAAPLDSELEHSCAQCTWIETEGLRRAILSFNSPADIFHSADNVFAFNFFQSLY
jgi:hypothetical protein